MKNAAQITIDGTTYDLLSRTTREDYSTQGLANLVRMMHEAGVVAHICATRPRARKAYMFNERLGSDGQATYQFVIRV